MFLLLTAFLVVAPAPPASGVFVIRERLSPTDTITSVEGSCGPHRYRVQLQARGQKLAVSVDGRSTPNDQIEKVLQSVPKGYFMFQPAVAECFWDRPNARVRLITDGPSSGGKSQWISFEVAPDGVISDVRKD